MAVLSALRTAVGALWRSPALFVAAFLYGLVQVPGSVLGLWQSAVFQLASAAYSLVVVLVAPFFLGGLLGMSQEALDGDASLSTFVAAGAENYLRLLAVTLLVAAASLIGAVVVAIVGFAALAVGPVGAVLAGAFALVLLVVAVVVGFLVQFYAQAVVVDDEGVLDAFRRSYRVVRANWLAVLGYDALVVAASAVVGAAGATFFFAADGATGVPSTSFVVGYAVYTLLFGTVLGALGAAYSVAFYVAVADDADAAAPAGGTDQDGGGGPTDGADDEGGDGDRRVPRAVE